MIDHRRNPPSQTALPLHDWSKADREAWTAAQQAGGVLYDSGVASHLSAQTLNLTRRYAYFLSFLAHRGKLDPHGPVAASVTEQSIVDYVRYLETHVSSVSLPDLLVKLERLFTRVRSPCIRARVSGAIARADGGV